MDVSSERYTKLSNDITVISDALIDWLKAQEKCSRVDSNLWDDRPILQIHESLSGKGCKEQEERSILSRVTDGSFENRSIS